MVNIKVIHKEAVRRFPLPTNASWIDLEAKLRPLFSIPALSPFTLSYTDEDNDIITLSTDVELQEILSTASTVKFHLKFSTSDDSSDSEDSGNEVWVLEGGNTKKAAKIGTDIPGFQDNVPQENMVSTTNQEPQFIEIDSHDIIESSSTNKKIPVEDNLKVDERKHQANLLDDDFFKSLNQLNTNIYQTSIEDKQQESIEDEKESVEDKQELIEGKQELIEEDQESTEDEQLVEDKQEAIEEASLTSSAFAHTSLELDQPLHRRRDLEVDLEQFQTMIELNQDAIKESPRLVASIKDIMDQIRQLDFYRQPTTLHKRNNNFLNRSITPPTPGYGYGRTIPQTLEPIRFTTPPPPIPGTFPTKKHSAKAITVRWAAQEHKNAQQPRNRGREDHRHHHKHKHDEYYDNNRDNRGQEDDKEETEEETEETTDLNIIYGIQLGTLKNMGFKDENALVELLDEHDGDVNTVAHTLLDKQEGR